MSESSQNNNQNSQTNFSHKLSTFLFQSLSIHFMWLNAKFILNSIQGPKLEQLRSSPIGMTIPIYTERLMMSEMFLSLIDKLLKNLQKKQRRILWFNYFPFQWWFHFFCPNHLCFFCPINIDYILFYQHSWWVRETISNP